MTDKERRRKVRKQREDKIAEERAKRNAPGRLVMSKDGIEIVWMPNGGLRVRATLADGVDADSPEVRAHLQQVAEGLLRAVNASGVKGGRVRAVSVTKAGEREPTWEETGGKP
jgi:hypothetical protein